MKNIFSTLFLAILVVLHAEGQVPRLINFQAAFHSEQGAVLSSEEVEVRITLLSGSAEGTPIYTETHAVTTTSLGIANIPLGSLDTDNSFGQIPWSETIFIKIEAKPSAQTGFITIDVSPLLSVPYAILANTNLPEEAEVGEIIYHNGNGWVSTSRVLIDPNSVEVVAQSPRKTDDPIFLVKNSAGQVVFAVYESGVVVNVATEDETKGTRGGFAVGGLSDQNKPDAPTYLYIMPDEVQFNILQPSDDKSTRGGFAVGGLSDQNKAEVVNFLTIKPDSARFSIENEAQRAKGTRGGFAVGGLSDQNKNFVNWLHLNEDTTFIQTQTLTISQNVNVSQNLVVGGNIGTIPVKDIDGNTYRTVRIGDQVWMAQNLRVTRYRNGSPIYSELTDTTIGSMGLFPHELVDGIDTDSEMLAGYGRLYNWYAVNNSQGLCPTGWIVPTADDWVQLLDFIGGDENGGGKLKSRRTEGTHPHPRWDMPNTGATNITTFSGLPAGACNVTEFEENYLGLGQFGVWWSATAETDISSYFLSLGYDSGDVQGGVAYKGFGLSVRCIKATGSAPTVTTYPVTNITPSSAFVGGNVTADGGSPITSVGLVWSKTGFPSIEDNDGIFIHQAMLGEFSLTITGLEAETAYTLAAFASNKNGTTYGNPLTFTTPDFNNCGVFTDQDGNQFKTVIINDQCWMRENLNVSKFNDGEPIGEMGQWQEPGYAPHSNPIYGSVYNGWAAIDERLCPQGWYLPSGENFETLVNYLGGRNVAGLKLKSTGTIQQGDGLWEEPNPATNESGFSGLPGGYGYQGDGIEFWDMGLNGYWWSSSDYSGPPVKKNNRKDEPRKAKTSDKERSEGQMALSLNWSSTEANLWPNFPEDGYSVRCIWGEGNPRMGDIRLNNTTLDQATITAEVISDGGDVNYPILSRGIVLSANPSPSVDSYDYISTDPLGEIGSFTLTLMGLNNNTAYYARAYATNGVGTAYSKEIKLRTYNQVINDIDDNSYYTVVIGDQHWLARNLNVTKYNDGSELIFIDPQTAHLHDGAYYTYSPLPGDNAVNVGNFYSISIINDSKSICPVGWRIPLIEDWETLIDYLGGSEVAGGKMKTTSFDTEYPGNGNWLYPNFGATNESNFSAVPTGYQGSSGYFYGLPSFEPANAYFWSKTPSNENKNWSYSLSYSYSGIESYSWLGSENGHEDALSVRCIEDDGLPLLKTLPVSNLTTSSATTGGNIYFEGGSPVFARGVVWSANENPTIDNNDGITSDGFQGGEFESSITGLTSNHIYYLRAYATNANGTNYGNQIVFKTYFGVTPDIDDNFYYTVEIGTQLWMAQNLKTTRFSNGDEIPYISPSDFSWSSTDSPAKTWFYDSWYWDTDSASVVNAYGFLYNWYAINDSRNICPTGWRIPNLEDWGTLVNHLGGSEVAGGRMKSAVSEPNNHPRWSLPNMGATNESGFTGLPGGVRSDWGNFWDLGYYGFWWLAGQQTIDSGNSFSLGYWDTFTSNYTEYKRAGLSVRCIAE